MGAAKDVELVPYYENGVLVGEYPKEFVEWANAKAEKERLAEEAKVPNDSAHRLSYWNQMYAKCIFTMSAALLKNDWRIIRNFLKTAKTIEECEKERQSARQGTDKRSLDGEDEG